MCLRAIRLLLLFVFAVVGFFRNGPVVLAAVVSELVLVSEGYQAALAVCCSRCCFRLGPGV